MPRKKRRGPNRRSARRPPVCVWGGRASAVNLLSSVQLTLASYDVGVCKSRRKRKTNSQQSACVEQAARWAGCSQLSTWLGGAVIAGSPADFGKFIADDTEKVGEGCQVLGREAEPIRAVKFGTRTSPRPRPNSYLLACCYAQPMTGVGHQKHRNNGTYGMSGVPLIASEICAPHQGATGQSRTLPLFPIGTVRV
jgi:hypothetical protein